MNERRIPERSGQTNRRFVRAFWVTNHSAPYRRPVWQSLASCLYLKVVLLDDQIGSDRQSNRGSDWAESGEGASYAVDTIRSIRVRRGESVYYLGAGLLKLASVDVVLLGGWESPAYWQLAALARVSGVRRVGFYESHTRSTAHRGGLIAAIRRRWFRSLDAVVVPGEASARAVRDMGVDSSRVFVGFNAVDVAALAAAAQSHRTSHHGHRFVYIGQLIPRKNVATLVRAFNTVRLDSDHLTVVGVGDEERDLRALVQELDLADSVSFSGYVPQARLGETLGQSDTLVLPSHEEVWGLVVNEALAAGLHVVVSHAAGVADSVDGMPGVWVVEPDQKSLERGLSDARESFRGPIAAPPILDFTPERFADVFLAAFRYAITNPMTKLGQRRR